jgi:hypothetical protein
MYGTRIHAGLEVQIHKDKKKHQTTKNGNPIPRIQNPNVSNMNACMTKS